MQIPRLAITLDQVAKRPLPDWPLDLPASRYDGFDDRWSGAQALYRRRLCTWSEAGIHAVGRTINKRFDLDKNDRNTRHILQVAAPFALRTDHGGEEEIALHAMTLDATTSFRHGVVPKLIKAVDRADECEKELTEIIDWLEQGVPETRRS